MWPRFGLKNSLKVAAFKAEINSLSGVLHLLWLRIRDHGEALACQWARR
jgi:hypothetical protein